MQSIITHVDGSAEFRSIYAFNSKRQYVITLEELRSRLCIGLKIAARTLKYTTHQYICTIDFLTKIFAPTKRIFGINSYLRSMVLSTHPF